MTGPQAEHTVYLKLNQFSQGMYLIKTRDCKQFPCRRWRINLFKENTVKSIKRCTKPDLFTHLVQLCDPRHS